jgi:hypothetical protein
MMIVLSWWSRCSVFHSDVRCTIQYHHEFLYYSKVQFQAVSTTETKNRREQCKEDVDEHGADCYFAGPRECIIVSNAPNEDFSS